MDIDLSDEQRMLQDSTGRFAQGPAPAPNAALLGLPREADPGRKMPFNQLRHNLPAGDQTNVARKEKS